MAPKRKNILSHSHLEVFAIFAVTFQCSFLVTYPTGLFLRLHFEHAYGCLHSYFIVSMLSSFSYWIAIMFRHRQLWSLKYLNMLSFNQHENEKEENKGVIVSDGFLTHWVQNSDVPGIPGAATLLSLGQLCY